MHKELWKQRGETAYLKGGSPDLDVGKLYRGIDIFTESWRICGNLGHYKNKHHEDRRIKEWIVKIKMNVGDEGRQKTGRIQTRTFAVKCWLLPCAGYEKFFWDLGLENEQLRLSGMSCPQQGGTGWRSKSTTRRSGSGKEF